MATDRDKILQGLRFMAVAFPFIFMGPAVLFGWGIPAARNESYWFLGLGILFMGLAAFFFVKGLRALLAGFFSK